MTAWAEVIGDPVAHSLSPRIHRFWLDRLGLAGDYRATRVMADRLAAHLRERRGDPHWRGCNVTVPHKSAVLPLIDRIDPAAERIGAVNCIVAEGGALVGYNSDVDGIGAAIGNRAFARAVVIGAGGAARAMVDVLAQRGTAITLLARDPGKAEALAAARPFEAAADAFRGADLIVNASPLGMTHAPIPGGLIAALGAAPADALVFDMVYAPRETALLAAARARGLPIAQGLTMLIGQARRAFALFYGVAPPAEADAALLQRLDDGDIGDAATLAHRL
ncbi:shikimate dehydrogenase family protein [Allosphingosinicella indica]|uniref:Shikimate dehydrogenase (NADP(+)) n=1 Tax=Allosphingosinicella indica TaxID=941907 RepID=A0A1X7FZQ0_9SPHN|nr:shikimate dehydrogenase [Allosphingosinicella indica]SMF61600.1 shikimate dehydrogenase [Allosphingosinicella indica]